MNDTTTHHRIQYRQQLRIHSQRLSRGLKEIHLKRGNQPFTMDKKINVDEVIFEDNVTTDSSGLRDENHIDKKMNKK